MNGAKAYIDTNIFIYLYSNTDIEKKKQAFHTINQYERFISTQVINEFCNVCIRKLKLPLNAVRQSVIEICDETIEAAFY